MTRLTGLLAGLSLLILAGGEVRAQQCVPFPTGETIADVMMNQFGEHFLWRGQGTNGPYFELYVNPETGKWTQLAIIPERGLVCFAASGERSEINPVPGKGEGA